MKKNQHNRNSQSLLATPGFEQGAVSDRLVSAQIVSCFFLLFSAVVLNLGLLAFMAVWQPKGDTLVVIFVLFGLWGIADGIWMAQSNCLMGVLFPEKFEEAFTGLRVMQGLGPAIIFAFAQSLSMATKIYIMGAVCVLAMVGYLMSEHLLKKEMKAKEVTVYDTAEKV